MPAAETGRSCWGSGQQDARPLQGPLQTLGAATCDTKKEPTGLFFAACGRPCSFDSSYGLQVAATPVDIPSRWDPRANQSPTGALVTVLRTAALFDSRTGQIKNALARMRKGVFMTRTGIEPMLQP